MAHTFYSLALIHVVVAIDNAILAGMFLPWVPQANKRSTLVAVGVGLGLSQIFLAIGVDSLMKSQIFRLIAVAVLIWMSIRTMTNLPRFVRTPYPFGMAAKVFFYTLIGNLDNMVWLGSELKQQHNWLVFLSIGTIPLFVAAAAFLANQCERHQWILVLGAGMMAWAASALLVQGPSRLLVQGVPPWVMQALFSFVVLFVGFVARDMKRRRIDF